MPRTYAAQFCGQKPEIDSPQWETVPGAIISYYPWSENGYRPYTKVQMMHSKDGISVRFDTSDEPVLARYTQENDPVYKDSCVGLFVNFAPTVTEQYMNFEINANGTVLLEIGFGRAGRQKVEDRGGIKVQTRRQAKGFLVQIDISFDFIRQYYPKMEDTFAGNFQKCAEDNERPHFGSWSKIETATPDFHQPAFFGQIVLKPAGQEREYLQIDRIEGKFAVGIWDKSQKKKDIGLQEIGAQVKPGDVFYIENERYVLDPAQTESRKEYAKDLRRLVFGS